MNGRFVTFYYRNEHEGMQLETGYLVGYSRPGQIIVSDKAHFMVNPRRHDLAHIRHITGLISHDVMIDRLLDRIMIDHVITARDLASVNFMNKLVTGGYVR